MEEKTDDKSVLQHKLLNYKYLNLDNFSKSTPHKKESVAICLVLFIAR